MSSSSILLLQRRLSDCLIKPGGSLSFRSKIPLINLQIQTQWREDVDIQIFQTASSSSLSFTRTPISSFIPNLVISQQPDKRTSLGRYESHVLVELNPSSTKEDMTVVLPPPISILFQIPQQLNIHCQLEQGGSIDMGNSSKLEGDVTLSTTQGNMKLSKLRGHDISLLTYNGTIDVSQLLEAQSMNLIANKIHVKRIHGTTIQMKAQHSQNVKELAEEEQQQLDDPAIDISSLYVTGNGSALLDTTAFTTTTTTTTSTATASSNHDMQEPNNHDNHDNSLNKATTNFKSSIRCQSHHGHVIALTDPQHGVELGGVNGSFDVDSHHASIHIDSLAPDSISIVSVNDRLTLTLDRKLNADLRLLNLIQETTTTTATTNTSPLASSLARSECMMMSKDTKELEEGLYQYFNTGSEDENKNIDSTKSQEINHPKILIATSAFTPVPLDSPIPNWDPNILFVQGYVENQHLEPDSRFELKTRNTSSGGGKIRLEGAQQQALQGFFSSPTTSATTITTTATTAQDVNKGIHVDRPLIIGSSEGGDRITVESLSWLGAIARRYGLEDEERQHRSPSQLGRQATRRGRPLANVMEERRE